MTSFIHDIIVFLREKNVDISTVTFILPSKRAGIFLKNTISNLTETSIFAPSIVSIEEFVEDISGLTTVSNSELLFEFYDSYLKHTPKANVESFDKFSKWAQILIQDFNEIDRYLIEPSRVFEYLSAIKDIENQHWSLDEAPTAYVKNYLLFWKRLKFYYQDLKNSLQEKKRGYQGMVYKEAVAQLHLYIEQNPSTKHVFVGFNALNACEETIIQNLLHRELAEIYWDIDEQFIKNPIHEAGLFIRAHQKKWRYFKNNPLQWITTHYTEEKHIEIIGAPKNVGQIKHVGELLSKLQDQNIDLKKTALVLGDETLLLPLLNSLPSSIEHVNITMGLAIQFTPLASLFETLFRAHQLKSDRWYYKDIIGLLSHHYVKPLFETTSTNGADALVNYIQDHNITYATADQLKLWTTSNDSDIDLLFGSWEDTPKRAIAKCLELIYKLKHYFDNDQTKYQLPLEYLYKFYTIFNELDRLNGEFEHLNSIQVLYGLYKELMKNETLDFRGEPLQGLQIMGMLETRVLDFETVILTSVNEGILPAGKSNNSFIPFDVKLENKLPTYKEKDAVYGYHFYRLLQRAKNIYILYNTEPDVLKGGEKSRFITQLMIENIHNIKHYVVSPKVPVIVTQLEYIKKTPEVLKGIQRLAEKGFSPSSLTNYIRNPMDFYLDKILGISKFEDVEENVALNTLGTVIHNTLEDFYAPFVGRFITIKDVQQMKQQIHDTVNLHFKKEYKSGDITKGKNLIIYEIAKRYVTNFLNLEITDLKQGNAIKIIAVEADNKVPLYVESIDKTVILRGKVDRVDEYNGTTRIIDYKTGRVEPGKVEIVEWDDILTDYDKYSKSFQVLTYAYMMFKSSQIQLPVEAGIISFKSLSSGFMKFATKPSTYSRKKDQLISEETLDAFEIQLKLLISEIFNPEIDFIEKPLE